MENTISKLHAMIHLASLIKKFSNGRHTSVSISLGIHTHVEKPLLVHKDLKTKKNCLKKKIRVTWKKKAWGMLLGSCIKSFIEPALTKCFKIGPIEKSYADLISRDFRIFQSRVKT